MIFDSQEFQLEQVADLDHLFRVWPFLLSGLEELNGTLKSGEVSSEEFFLTHADVVTNRREGVVLKVNSKNGKELAYITAFDNTGKHKIERSLLVYAIYSNRKSNTASRFARESLEKWAREHGFDWLHAYMGRTSGSSTQWARRFHGFQLEKYFYTKKI